jgi:N-acetylneuraminic acid mutarotase
VLLVVVASAAVGLGFVAGRRYPFERLEGLFSTRPALAPGWTRFPSGPGPRYEATVAQVGRATYVLGGFVDEALDAGSDVHRWVDGGWRRLGDMPDPVTHRTPAVVGDTVWLAGGFVGRHPGPTTDEVWIFDPAADRWTRGPALPSPRGGGGFVALGRTLHYFGGYAADRNESREEHWALAIDSLPAGATWRAAAPLPSARGHLAAVALGGFVYAIGGVVRHDPAQIDVADVHRYEPAGDRWTAVASLPRPRSHFEPSTFVRRGRIVVVGGRSRPTYHQQLRDVTVYYPDLDRWLAAPPLPAPRLAPIAFALGDTLVAGLGAIDTEDRTDQIWMTLSKPGWWVGAPMPVPLGEVAAGIVGNLLVVVGQGDEATLGLDLGTGEWLPRDQLTRRPAVGDHHAAQVINGELYLVGGFGSALGITQIYDPTRNQWRFGPDPPFAAGASASAVVEGQLYLAGGISGDTTVATVAKLDPATGRWSTVAPMPLPRNHAGGATDGRRLFVFGGRGPGSGDGNTVANGFDQVQVYDPATDRWTVSGSDPDAPPVVPQGRGGMGTAVFHQGEFYLIGGETRDGPGATRAGVYDRVDIYDPRARTWRQGPPLATARHGISPVAIADRIYVVAGGVRAGRSASTAVEILTTP